MDSLVSPQVSFAAIAGIVAGLALLWRGFGGYRTATRIADTGTSSIASMAAGEVRLSGVIEPAEVTLVSPLQSAACVYYHATIEVGGERSDGGDLDEERAVGFVLRDQSGAVRIFPRGARWDAPLVFDGSNDVFGGAPPGLALRTGGAIGPSELDREAAIAQLLAVRATTSAPSGSGRRAYKEHRLAPGDAVTIIGRAVPFGILADPTEADVDVGSVVAAADADRFEQRFHIAPEALVLASAPDVPLLIAYGVPGAAVERHQDRFIIGLLGAILAIGSALALAIGVAGGFGP